MVNQEEKQLTEKTDSEKTQIMVVDDEEGIVKFMKSYFAKSWTQSNRLYRSRTCN